MELLPPLDSYYERTSIVLLIQDVNKLAARQGYAVVQDRSKVSKRGVCMKHWIRCDRSRIAKQEGHGHRNTSSRRVKCPFKAVAKLENNLEDKLGLGTWTLTVKCPDHNYPPTKPSASVAHRKEALKDLEVRRELEKEWRKGSKINSTLKELRLNLEESIFKPRNIWRHRALHRHLYEDNGTTMRSQDTGTMVRSSGRQRVEVGEYTSSLEVYEATANEADDGGARE